MTEVHHVPAGDTALDPTVAWGHRIALARLMAAKTLDEFLAVPTGHISEANLPSVDLYALDSYGPAHAASAGSLPVEQRTATDVLALLLRPQSRDSFSMVEIPSAIRRAAAPPGLSLYEKIHQGYIVEELPYRHPKVMVAVSKKQAAQGEFLGAHLLVIPATRERLDDNDPSNMDNVPAEQEMLTTIAGRATAYWLRASFPGASYVARAVAGIGVDHAHTHIAAGDKKIFAALGSDDANAMVELTADEWNAVKDRVTFPRPYAELLTNTLDQAETLTYTELDERYKQLKQMALNLATEMGFRPTPEPVTT